MKTDPNKNENIPLTGQHLKAESEHGAGCVCCAPCEDEFEDDFEEEGE